MKLFLLFLLPFTLTSQTYICDSIYLVTTHIKDGPYDKYVDARAVSAVFIINEESKVIVRNIDCNVVIYYNAYTFHQTIDNKPYTYYQSDNDENGQHVIFMDPYLNSIKYVDTSNDKYMYLFNVTKVIPKK
jgi:hypothetical protein